MHYDQWERYGSAKLANILFTQELQRQFTANGSPVIAVSLHPGTIMDTEVKRQLVAEYLKSLPVLAPAPLESGVSDPSTGHNEVVLPKVIPTEKTVKQGELYYHNIITNYCVQLICFVC